MQDATSSSRQVGARGIWYWPVNWLLQQNTEEWRTYITSWIIKLRLAEQLMYSYNLLITQRLHRHFGRELWPHFT